MIDWIDIFDYEPCLPDIYLIRVNTEIYSAYPCYSVFSANFNGNYFYDQLTCKCIADITHWTEMPDHPEWYEEQQPRHRPIIGNVVTVG